jgi:hypothetical protein
MTDAKKKPTRPIPDAACQSCRFFSLNDGDGIQHGICRCHAPHLSTPRPGDGWNTDTRLLFPEMFAMDWCGDFETRTQTARGAVA